MSKIGYARVSTFDQHPEVQADRLKAAGCDPKHIFADTDASGRSASRPEWDKCLEYLRPGDTLVTVRLDRIGRSVKNLIEVLQLLDERQVDLVVLDQNIDTSTPTGKLIFHVIAAIAEFEADLIHERTMDGLAAARARGRKGGRKPKLDPGQVATVRRMYNSEEHTVEEIAAVVGVHRTTIYDYLRRSEPKKS